MTRPAALGTTLAALALYAVTAVISLRPVADRDIWWHLRTGEWIVQHGAVPHVDPFAVDGPGKPWMTSSWLFDVLVDALHRSFGPAALAAYALVLGLACVLALQRLGARHVHGPITTVALPALAFAVLAPLLGPRPALVSIVFYAIELSVLFSALEGGNRRGLWLLPPLFALWANLDRGVGHGVLVLALATVAQRLERRRRAPDAPDDSLPELARVTLLCGLAALLTPYHVGLYSAMLDTSGQGAARERLGDLASPTFRTPSDWVMLVLLLGAVFITARRSRHRVFMLLVLVVSAFLAFRASRDAWLVAVSATAVLSSGGFCGVAHVTARRLGVGAVTAGIAGMVVWFLTPVQPRWQSEVSARFPVAAATVVDERRYPGPVFSPLEWGGYLLWRLPRLSTVIDGRLELQGNDRIRRLIGTWDGGREWAADPDLAGAGTVVAPADSSLTTLLHDDPRFVVVYTDDVAALFVARRAAHGSGP